MLYKGIKHARMFRVSYPSIPNHLLNDLNEESVISLGIIVYDTQRHMFKKIILLYILYMLCIKNKHSNNINNERNKEKLHLLLLLIREKIDSTIPTKF